MLHARPLFVPSFLRNFHVRSPSWTRPSQVQFFIDEQIGGQGIGDNRSDWLIDAIHAYTSGCACISFPDAHSYSPLPDPQNVLQKHCRRLLPRLLQMLLLAKAQLHNPQLIKHHQNQLLSSPRNHPPLHPKTARKS